MSKETYKVKIDLSVDLLRDTKWRPAKTLRCRHVKRDLSVKRDLLSVKSDLLSVKRDLLSVKRDLLSVKRDLLSVKRDLLSV